ncbi:MAG TPA: hypothetical protein DCW90_01475, partial [Lachnospiraceae bacterium]|nr:hypothetical protein [Lachnospiraceae bacterium]
MNKIPTICYEDIYEFCASLNFEFENRYEMADEDDTISISVVAKYDNARNIINILTGYGYEIANMEFHDPEYDGYKDEYIITICVRLSNNDIMEIWCEPAKRKDDYLILGGDIVYILNECNIKVVKKIESDKIYFVELEDEIEDEYDDFHNRTRYILNFQDEPVDFSDYDFMEHSESFETKEVYQSEKLKAYIKKDYRVLEDYAENTRTHSDIFHMFVENINLSKRERKSSFKDDWSGGKSFFRSYDICDEYEQGSYLVVSDDIKEEYDPFSMVRLMDFGSFEEKPKIGDFVKLNGLIQMFVFLMKPIPEERLHSLRVYIDGLRIFNYETTIFLDSQYIYLPVEDIRPNSYIMIEDHHEGSFVANVIFSRDNTTKSFTIMNMNKPLYSSDIYLLDSDGYEIDPSSYKISFNNTYFDDPREIEDAKNNHIVLSNFNIELLDSSYFEKALEVRAIKKFETYEIQMKRRGFPRLSLHSVQNCRNKNHIEVFVNGKVLPENLYRVDKLVSNGILRIQLLLLVEAGSNVIIDISPYTHSVRGIIDRVDTSRVINLDHIINKPVSIDYYV